MRKLISFVSSMEFWIFVTVMLFLTLMTVDVKPTYRTCETAEIKWVTPIPTSVLEPIKTMYTMSNGGIYIVKGSRSVTRDSNVSICITKRNNRYLVIDNKHLSIY